MLNYGQISNGSDANHLNAGTYYCLPGTLNIPTDFCYLLCIEGGGDTGQLAFNVINIWFRRKSGNIWSEWKAVFQ